MAVFSLCRQYPGLGEIGILPQVRQSQSWVRAHTLLDSRSQEALRWGWGVPLPPQVSFSHLLRVEVEPAGGGGLLQFVGAVH